MAYTIEFTGNIDNDSLQIGDYVYSITPFQLGDFNQSINTSNNQEQPPILLGIVTDITNNSITIDDTNGNPTPPSQNDFIMFSKDSSINLSGLIGYYAQATFVNTSNEKAELYSVGSEVTASSK
jgi:23S rRNA A1618 N6-methylase RlmF